MNEDEEDELDDDEFHALRVEREMLANGQAWTLLKAAYDSVHDAAHALYESVSHEPDGSYHQDPDLIRDPDVDASIMTGDCGEALLRARKEIVESIRLTVAAAEEYDEDVPGWAREVLQAARTR